MVETKHFGRYFRNKLTGAVVHVVREHDLKVTRANPLYEEVTVQVKPKPVSGTVTIIKTSEGRYLAEKGDLLTNGQFMDPLLIDERAVVVARLRWTEGDGLWGVQ